MASLNLMLIRSNDLGLFYVGD